MISAQICGVILTAQPQSFTNSLSALPGTRDWLDGTDATLLDTKVQHGQLFLVL